MRLVDRFSWLRQDDPQGERLAAYPLRVLRQDHPQGERLAAYPLRVLRRDGAPLAISLGLHVLALLLIAPWLVMRTIPAPPVEVEVMLEPENPLPPRSRPEQATRPRAPAKAQRPPVPLPAQRPPVQVARQAAPPPLPSPPSEAPAAQPGQGLRGQGAAAPRETAGLSAPNNPPATTAATLLSAGLDALQRGSVETAMVLSRSPSLGSAPQPSARAAAAPARPGEDREDGPVTLSGPAPQAQAAQPEFRQAARLGGQASMRGGSQAPDDGLARQPGAPDQVALFAAPAAPQALPGSAAGRGGLPSALSPPPLRASGQGGTVAAEPAASAGTLLANAPVTGSAAPLTSRVQPGSGHGGAGGGASDSRSLGPGERGSGLLAAAAPGASGPGTAVSGAGPGAASAGEGRAQLLAGGGSAPRDTAAAALTGGGLGAAASARGDGERGGAQFSDRAEPLASALPLRETRVLPLQAQQPMGQARVIEERFTATALKVDSPRSICELPLMFAGFDHKPIPKGLDTINASVPMVGEVPPRHHPGNQSPHYPLFALGVRAEGRVLVRAEIRADGQIGNLLLKQSSGFQVLDQAALDTVRGWRFTPAQRYGMAVAMWMDVPIEYKIPKELNR